MARFRKEELPQYGLILIIALAMLQFVAYLLKQYIPAFGSFKIGILFYIMILFGLIYIGFILVFKSFTLSRAQFLGLVIATAIFVLLLVKIKAFVPEIFSVANVQLEAKATELMSSFIP